MTTLYKRVAYDMTLHKRGNLFPEPPYTNYSNAYATTRSIRAEAEWIALTNLADLVGLELHDDETGRKIDILHKDTEIIYK